MISIEASDIEVPRARHYIGSMKNTELAMIGALTGDPTRANILVARMDGRGRTATELAQAAGVSPPTGSWHLSGLADGQLLVVQKHGRHRYYRLASPLVAQMLETMMTAAAAGRPRHRFSSRLDEALRTARICYDHLAGRLGVRIADVLRACRQIVLAEDGGQVTAAGARFLTEFGIDLAAIERRRRAFCRPCLDWSERRPHLAGAIGAAVAARCFDLGWVERGEFARAVVLTPAGERGFHEAFGIASLYHNL